METSDELFSKANDEFVNENYQKAVDLFTEAIKANANKAVYYTNRAHAYFKIGEYEKAIVDTEKCLSLDPNSEKALFRKGICQFELKNYQDALKTFQNGKKLSNKNETFEVWLKSCREKLGLPEPNEVISNSHDDQKLPQSKSVEAAAAPLSPSPPSLTPSRTKHDWYQTQSHAVITVLIKKLKEEDVKADYGEKTLNLIAKLSSGEDYKLDLNLANEIIPDQCQTKVTPSKIEIKLKKRDGIHWNKLEGSPDCVVNPITVPVPTGCEQNTVNTKSRNWDKFVRDVTEMEKNEKPEGDAALNHLFQQIYADGSDDVKRAMVKSFYESGGTVLSTNWSEVGEKAVEVKPPSGMEYKQWET